MRAVSERVAEAPPEGAVDSERPSSNFDGEDFLYHLYRGSELLQDNCVGEAKEELERALALQPQDAAGQGLLAVVYFRLGLYPRAIRIFEDLVRAVPTEITPRVNLGLCYLKTGQNTLAREVLEEVTRRVPNHRRAWGYLGLLYERMNDFEKALEAFHRAGHEQMARRMERVVAELAQPEPSEGGVNREAVRRAAADAIQELEEELSPFAREDGSDPLSRFGRWHAVELGEERLPPPSRRAPKTLPPRTSLAPTEAPPPHAAFAPAELIAGLSIRVPAPERLRLRSERLAVVRVEGAFAVRLDWVRALEPERGEFRGNPLRRRSRGRDTDEPLGGLRAPLVLLEGTGSLMIASPEGTQLVPVVLEKEFFYVREDRLVGFDSALRHESGRLSTGMVEHVPMVQLSGEGALLFRATTQLSVVEVGDGGALLRGDDVVGWTGRLLPQPVRPANAPANVSGFVAFSGQGAVFIDPA